MIHASVFTYSSLTASHRCMMEYHLAYNLRLEPIGYASEALDVGTAWHAGLEAYERQRMALDGPSADEVILKLAPSPLWAEKLRRLHYGHRWYWKDDGLEVVATEESFHVELDGAKRAGKLDLRVRVGNRVGLVEHKTTSESVESGSPYWDRLRMDTQVGIYGEVLGRPDFILYDAVRKPTIEPKGLNKADVARLTAEVANCGSGVYFSETFSAAELESPLAEARESIRMYGARLTADMGDRPTYYFGRREVSRTTADYESLRRHTSGQIALIQHANATGNYPRNPNACQMFGLCKFFRLCSHNIEPDARGLFANPMPDSSAPDGFTVRGTLHKELETATLLPRS